MDGCVSKAGVSDMETTAVLSERACRETGEVSPVGGIL